MSPSENTCSSRIGMATAILAVECAPADGKSAVAAPFQTGAAFVTVTTNVDAHRVDRGGVSPVMTKFHNNVKTALLLGLLTGLILWIGSFWGEAGLTMALIFAGITNLGAYFFSDKIAL